MHCSISSARRQQITNTLLFLRDELRSKYSVSANMSELPPHIVSPVCALFDGARSCRLAGDGKYSFTFTGALTIKCASGQQRQLKKTSTKAEVNAYWTCFSSNDISLFLLVTDHHCFHTRARGALCSFAKRTTRSEERTGRGAPGNYV